MAEVIICWKSKKWETLHYFSNHEIIIAVFHEDDYTKDYIGLGIRDSFPNWKNSWIGEDIKREFNTHEHRKKAVWCKFHNNSDETAVIKYCFSYLTLSSERDKTETIIFDLCCLCQNVIHWCNRYNCNWHLKPGGESQRDACPQEDSAEEEKQGNFFTARIQGL